MAVGTPEGIIKLGTFPLQLERGGIRDQAVEIERLESRSQVSGEMG